MDREIQSILSWKSTIKIISLENPQEAHIQTADSFKLPKFINWNFKNVLKSICVKKNPIKVLLSLRPHRDTYNSTQGVKWTTKISIKSHKTT